MIYAPSFSSQAWENADLCEYLASHGYVVNASPSLGPTTRQMVGTIAGANAHARDISFLIGYAESADNEIPKHFLVESFRAASGVAPSFVGFRNEVLKEGAEHASDIYLKMRQETPDFKLDEQALESWAATLMSNAQVSEAIEILKVNAQMHPDSGGVYFSLALAYEKAGQIPLAIENYKSCLKYWPTNPDLGDRIKKLSATKPADKSAP